MVELTLNFLVGPSLSYCKIWEYGLIFLNLSLRKPIGKQILNWYADSRLSIEIDLRTECFVRLEKRVDKEKVLTKKERNAA